MGISGAGTSKTSYTEVAKKLKDGVDLDSLGVKVTELKYVTCGAITTTVGRGAEGALPADKLRVAVEAVFGADAEVRACSNALRLQMMGISQDDDPMDVQDGLTREGVPLAQIGVE